MIAVASLILIVLVIMLAARIGAVALVATGLPVEVARFQARSALTGVGYTTSESETIVGHPVRRRIIMAIMLIGNAGLVSIIASVILSLVSAGETSDVLVRLVTAIGGIVFVGLIARSKRFERAISTIIARFVNRFTDLELRDYHHLMQLSRDYAVSELFVHEGEWMAGRSLQELELPDEGVLVLAVQRVDGGFVGAPRGATVVHVGDTLVLYGRTSVLTGLAERPATTAGDKAHEEAKAEQSEIMEEQRHEGSGA
ncbi:MAG: TrkA C-terminal domain-containing protein [Acidimicrobiia bacterium]|nr:TrkA C-terminal domain-containing protein [Acidimicrobiia bacterium]